MKTSDALTTEGRDWLSRPLSLDATPGLLALCPPVEAVFECSRVEAAVALIQVAAMAMGPALLIDDPFGRSYPASVQVLSSCEPGSNYRRALSSLSRMTVDIFAEEYGRASHRGQVPKDAGYLSKMEGDAAAVARARQEHRNALFPIGDILDEKVVAALVQEAQEVNFASISEGAALRFFCGASTAARNAIAKFVNAGWDGTSVPGRDLHPIYPAVNLLWMSSPQERESAAKVLTALGGLLVASPHEGFVPSDPSASPTMSLKPVRDLLEWVASTARMPIHFRHVTPQAILRIQLNDEAAQLLRTTTRLACYGTPASPAAAFLASAPMQACKIAALLTLTEKGVRTIDLPVLKNAMEIYRWFARGTIETLQRCPAAETPPTDLEILVGKLRLHGPLSRRELARKYDRITVHRLGEILSQALAAGLIEEKGGKYCLVAPIPGNAECQSASASVGTNPTNFEISPTPA